ncbi:hypothetical protein BRADI_2g43961v3 [Brachypodium distachyon]|uniref:Uncharacterized protein n=2 Tax=Brachypodium distachyon TaxID=15368 RepID=A0A2K2DDS4_BRADI|nr:hypothetical protein BRADI_2g43961v3 [Brachypodium distachyon]
MDCSKYGGPETNFMGHSAKIAGVKTGILIAITAALGSIGYVTQGYSVDEIEQVWRNFQENSKQVVSADLSSSEDIPLVLMSSSDDEDAFDPTVIWLWDPKLHNNVPAYKLDDVEVDQEKAELTLIQSLYDKAKMKGEKPCLICCLRSTISNPVLMFAKYIIGNKLKLQNRDAKNELVWVTDDFYTAEGMVDLVRAIHKTIMKRGATCAACGNVFLTSALHDIHHSES